LLSQVGAPMRAELASGLPDRNDYLFEVKYDGYRLLVAVAGGHSQVVTRKGNDWTSRFAPIARAVESLPVREAVLDGEACIVDAHGRSSFEALQGWLGGNKSAGTLVFAAFDLLWTDGRDLRGLPIEERRQLLEALVKGAPSPLAFSRALDGSLRELEAAGRKAGLEGLIAKRKGSSYGAGVTGAWWKLKFRREEEVAIAGYIPRSDADDEVGALLIAVSDGKDGFEPAGRVGTGFDKATRKKLAKMLDAIASDVPTVTGRPRVPGARWAKVKYVAQIALTEWTRDGSARAPSFLGLREDKEPSECVRERETEVRVADHPAARSPHGAKPGRMASDKASGEEAPLTNPKKVIFPRDGITKTDIAEYYSAVSRVMLPHLAGRPVGLQRWPNGIDHDAWFQQNAPEKVPPFVTVIDPGGGHDSKRKILVQNEATLIWLANLAALTIHQWASHLPDASVSAATRAKLLEQADYTVIDLDPGDGPWAHLVKVAKALRSLLEKLDLASVVKTSGQRGLHILIPWRRGPSHEDATDFGRKIASAVAAALPEIATVERMKAKRGGRLYIDFLQNGSGKTIVAPYSIRAKDGAPVSTPVEWSEVTDALDPKKFTIRTVPERVAKKGDLLAPLLTGPRDMPAVR
jgi:bifunctional non-homologous end joining protein LigD